MPKKPDPSRMTQDDFSYMIIRNSDGKLLNDGKPKKKRGDANADKQNTRVS